LASDGCVPCPPVLRSIYHTMIHLRCTGLIGTLDTKNLLPTIWRKRQSRTADPAGQRARVSSTPPYLLPPVDKGSPVQSSLGPVARPALPYGEFAPCMYGNHFTVVACTTRVTPFFFFFFGLPSQAWGGVCLALCGKSLSCVERLF
jgi:hypothetical protein